MLHQSHPPEGMSFRRKFLGRESKVNSPLWRTCLAPGAILIGGCPRWDSLGRFCLSRKIRTPLSSELPSSHLFFLLGRSRRPVRLHLPFAPAWESYRRGSKLPRSAGKIHHIRRSLSPVSILSLCNHASATLL